MLLFGALMLSPATSSAQTPDADFTARCQGAPKDGSGPSPNGIVKRCFNLDTAPQIPTTNGQDCWGCNFGNFAPAPQAAPVIDTTIKTSGAGSLKFTSPAGGGSAASGSWFTNFSNPATAWQIGEGQEVWIQYRYRPDALSLSQANNPTPNNTSPGFKLSHVGTGDTAACNTGTGKSTANCPGSCSDMEIVLDPAWKPGGVPMIAYATCGSPIGQPPLLKNLPGADYDFHPNWTGSPARNCHYQGTNWGEPNCFNVEPNKWNTIKYHIKVGHWNTWDSTIEIFAGHEGQPTQKIISCGPTAPCSDNNGNTVNGWYIYNSNTSLYKLGKIWLDPYVTLAGGPVQTQNVWFSELIISSQDIADPGASASNVAPKAPCCLSLTQLGPASLVVVLGVILFSGRRWARRGPRWPVSSLRR